MATNLSHVTKAANNLAALAESAANAIEEKEVEGEHDSTRIDAFMDFKQAVEDALDDLQTAIEGTK